MVAARRHRTPRHQGVVADDLRADESALDVAVDFARGDRSREVAWNGPRAAFVLADREERDVAEELVARADHAIESGFLQAEVREERRGVGRLELRDFELDLRAD